MKHALSLGGLSLEAELLPSYIPRGGEVRDWVVLNVAVQTPYSRCVSEKLLLSLRDLLKFRGRLSEFLRRGKFRAVALETLMPSFDMMFTLRPGERVLLEVRLSPEIRLERHMYDFDLTLPEVESFSRALEAMILSFPKENAAGAN